MNEFTQYEHFGKEVWVRSDLKGRHRNHCLCWACAKFDPMDREHNCPIANTVYSICVLQNLVLPVWECPEFQEAAAMDDGGEHTTGAADNVVS